MVCEYTYIYGIFKYGLCTYIYIERERERERGQICKYIHIYGMMTHCFLNPCMSVLAMRNVRLVSDFGTHVDESLLPHCGKVEPEQNVESVYSPQTAARHAQEAAGAQSHSKAADTLHNKLLQLV